MAGDIGVAIVAAVQRLPTGFNPLRLDAHVVGHCNLDRVAEAPNASARPGVPLAVNPRTEQAVRFWEASGFMPDQLDDHTHTLSWRGS